MANTTVELFEEQVHQSSVRPALHRYRDGMWEDFTWKEWWDASERIAAGLMTGEELSEGDRVCLVSSTRVEWVVVDMGLAMAGAVSVALHPAVSAEELGRVVAQNDVTTVIVEDPVQLGKVVEACRIGPGIDRVIYFEEDVLVDAPERGGRDFVRLEGVGVPQDLEVKSLDHVRGRGREALAADSRVVARRRRSIDGDTVAAILYTAGVSARPRGVVLTHQNLAAQIEALSALHLFSSQDVQLLNLPLAHIFARMLYLAAVGYGMATVFGRGAHRLVDDLAEMRPTLMASVPRVYERLQEEIEERIRKRKWRSRLLPVAVEVGNAVRNRLHGGDRVGPVLRWEHRFFRRILLEDVRQWLGGEMRFLISGGAPLAKETIEFFFAAGVLLLEGYGLTETAGAVSFNMPDDFRFGSVGRPLPGVDVTLAEDGEILVRGKTVMRSYVCDDGEEEGFHEDRWLHTGDIGRFDPDGFLYLTDRKREVIVTSTGKHVVPSGLEEGLCEHPMVAHAVVVGEGRPFLGALLGLEPDGVLEFVKGSEIDTRLSVRELTEHPRIKQELRRHVDEVNRARASYEHVRRFSILPEFLTTGNRMVTMSGTLRRTEVLRRYRTEVEALFDNDRRPSGG